MLHRATMSSLASRRRAARDRKGRTPLHVAAIAGADDSVAALLAIQEVRPDVTDSTGDYAMDVATRKKARKLLTRQLAVLCASIKPR